MLQMKLFFSDTISHDNSFKSHNSTCCDQAGGSFSELHAAMIHMENGDVNAFSHTLPDSHLHGDWTLSLFYTAQSKKSLKKQTDKPAEQPETVRVRGSDECVCRSLTRPRTGSVQ